VLALPEHIIEEAEDFSLVPASHLALAHVAFAVQQFVFAFAVVSPLVTAAFELSWYMDAPQSTVAEPHLEVSERRQQVVCTQDLTFVEHIVLFLAVFSFEPDAHVSWLHVALAVQQFVFPASAPRVLAALAVS